MSLIIGLTQASDGALKSVYVGESRAAAEKKIRDAASAKDSGIASGWVIPNPTKYRVKVGGGPKNAALTEAQRKKAQAEAEKAAKAAQAAANKARIDALEARIAELKG